MDVEDGANVQSAKYLEVQYASTETGANIG
jgi:hypothetical protein